MRCAGRAQAGYDLSFEPLGPGPRARGDWDLTDEDGRFEVELQAARYAVRDERDVQVAEVVVPAGRAEFVLDFDLPQAWRNTLVGGDSP